MLVKHSAKIIYSFEIHNRLVNFRTKKIFLRLVTKNTIYFGNNLTFFNIYPAHPLTYVKSKYFVLINIR